MAGCLARDDQEAGAFLDGTVDHAGWIVMLLSPEEQSVYARTRAAASGGMRRAASGDAALPDEELSLSLAAPLTARTHPQTSRHTILGGADDASDERLALNDLKWPSSR